MALIDPQSAADGGAITMDAAAAGDQIEAGSRAGNWSLGVILVVSNGDAAAMDVTVAGHAPVTIPAGGIGIVPVHRGTYGTVVDVEYTSTTSVTRAAVQLAEV